MFGTPATDLERVYEQAGLKGVENPFILIFLNLGIVGVPIYALAMLAYFIYLRRAYPDSGWLLFSGVIILFSSNSIGVKTPDLFMMTACAIAMKGSFGTVPSDLKVRLPTRALMNFRTRMLVPGNRVETTEMSIATPHRALSGKVTRSSKWHD
jgi:hypothetical protein